MDEADVLIEAMSRRTLSTTTAGRLDCCTPGLNRDALDFSQQERTVGDDKSPRLPADRSRLRLCRLVDAVHEGRALDRIEVGI